MLLSGLIGVVSWKRPLSLVVSRHLVSMGSLGAGPSSPGCECFTGDSKEHFGFLCRKQDTDLIELEPLNAEGLIGNNHCASYPLYF